MDSSSKSHSDLEISHDMCYQHSSKTAPILTAKVVPDTAATKRQFKTLSIGGDKYVKVQIYRQKPYVNIRTFITAANGKTYKSKRGILLHPEEWKQLRKVGKEIDQELKNM